MRSKSKLQLLFFVALVIFVGPKSSSASNYVPGSVSFLVSQRFFNDSHLKYVHHHSEWVAPAFDLSVGAWRFPFGIEPLIGLGFVKNSSSQFGLSPSGTIVNQPSPNSIDFWILSVSSGARYKPWGPDFFFIEPYIEGQFVYRYIRAQFFGFNPTSGAFDADGVKSGSEFGVEIGGGAVFSFMYDRARRNNLQSTFGVNEFGLLTSLRYLPTGFYKNDPDIIKNTGGWDFGLGFYIGY